MTRQPPSSQAAIALRYPPFPKGKLVLTLADVAKCWRTTEKHISDLIEEGALQAFNVGSGPRKYWRIPQEAYEDFIQRRHSLTIG